MNNSASWIKKMAIPAALFIGKQVIASPSTDASSLTGRSAYLCSENPAHYPNQTWPGLEMVGGEIDQSAILCSSQEKNFNQTLRQSSGIDPFENLHFDGASNTKGIGASLPFEHLVKWHLAHQEPAIQSQIKSKKIWVSIDYFFPTRFSSFDESTNTTSLQKAVEAKVSSLLQNYNIVILPILPNLEDVSEDFSFRTRSVQDGYLSAVETNSPTPSLSPLEGDSFFTQKFYALKDLVKGLFYGVDGLSFIYGYLSDATRIERVRTINQVIQRLALKHPTQISTVSLSHPDLLEALSWQRYAFKDPLHLSDTGLALVFNHQVKLALERHLDLEMSPLELRGLTEDDVRRARALIYREPEDFQQQVSGYYWAPFLDVEHFSLENAQIFLPHSRKYVSVSQALQSMKSQTLRSTRRGSRSRSPIRKDSSTARSENLNLMLNLAQIIHSVRDERSGIPILLPATGATNPPLGLDLTQALFYTINYLNRQEDGSYSNWGYDHWLSYGTIYYPKTGDFLRNPGTNYFFELRPNYEDPLQWVLTWKIFPLVQGQEEVSERWSYLPESISRELHQSPHKYPHLKYEVEIRVSQP